MPPISPSKRTIARPMSVRHVRSPVIVVRISPATVWIEEVSDCVQPCSRRYSSAWRAPLPDSSASEPSGL